MKGGDEGIETNQVKMTDKQLLPFLAKKCAFNE